MMLNLFVECLKESLSTAIKNLRTNFIPMVIGMGIGVPIGNWIRLLCGYTVRDFWPMFDFNWLLGALAGIPIGIGGIILVKTICLFYVKARG